MAPDGRIPSNQRFVAHRPGCARGFTLLELMLTGAVCGLLLAIAVPSYHSIVERQRVEQCVRDLQLLGQRIEKYRTMHAFEPPMSLAELGDVPKKDPWGFDYRYLNFEADLPGVQGAIRKDHNLHPLNSEFDLYSVGPDGKSQPPLTAKASRDDVIWARDGAFVGVARDF
jgi:general secretion pathway protein G